jgi:hypothetical protein
MAVHMLSTWDPYLIERLVGTESVEVVKIHPNTVYYCHTRDQVEYKAVRKCR